MEDGETGFSLSGWRPWPAITNVLFSRVWWKGEASLKIEIDFKCEIKLQSTKSADAARWDNSFTSNSYFFLETPRCLSSSSIKMSAAFGLFFFSFFWLCCFYIFFFCIFYFIACLWDPFSLLFFTWHF